MAGGIGLFARWQPLYAEYGISTFPVTGKKPAVRGYLRVGPAASRDLTLRFGQADAIGFALARAGIVVVDVDAPEERVLVQALDQHGATPFVVRSGSGNFQAWYRRRNEGRLIRPDPRLPIDILGDGFVVAPPSMGARGRYEIIQGGLEDLERLPRLKISPRDGQCADTVLGPGNRNDTLWRRCMEQARYCDDFDALLDVGLSCNDAFDPPLSEAEVEKTTRSVWDYTTRGSNWFGRRPFVVTSHDEVDGLLSENPDALVLLIFLRRHHWDRDFVVANGLAEHMPGGRWTLKRLSAARKLLLARGLVTLVRPASSYHGAAVYRFETGQN